MPDIALEEFVERPYQISYIQNISHLLAIAVDRYWPTCQRSYYQPSKPSLILYAELPFAIDATHSKDARLQPICMSVVLNIGIRCQLRRPIGTVPCVVNGEALWYPLHELGVPKIVTASFFQNGNIVHVFAINLVGAAENNCAVVKSACLQDVESSQCIGFKIRTRIFEASSNRNLTRSVNYGVCRLGRFFERWEVSQIGFEEFDLRVSLHEIIQIVFLDSPLGSKCLTSRKVV